MTTLINKNSTSFISGSRLKTLLATSTLAAGLLTLAAPANAQDHAWVLNQVGGSFSTDTTVPNITNITQHSSRAIGEGNLDIAAYQTVNIRQGSSNDLFVARDIRDYDATVILGNLNANGRVMVIDGNGVFFAPGSTVNVGGIIATTGDIANADIMSGANSFAITNFGAGSVINEGLINVADSGLAAFVSPTVVNNGVINARLGKVSFGAGSKVTLDLYGDQLLEIAVDDKAANALIKNAGTVNAEGGVVQMTAQAAKAAVDDVINMNGVVNVASVTQVGGKIILSGGAQGVVNVAGKIDASGTDGGTVDIKGQNILATGEIKADGQNNGGSVVLWGDSATYFTGLIAARGKGGFVETSGGLLGVTGRVQIGDDGEWLLDPTNIVIQSASSDTNGSLPSNPFSPDDTGDNSRWTIRDTALEATLNAGGIVTLKTHANGINQGDIIVDAQIDKNSASTSTLRFEAHDDIIINKNIVSTNGKLNIELIAGYSETGSPDANTSINSDGVNDVNIYAAIDTKGGDFSAEADHDVFLGVGQIITGTGVDTGTQGTGSIVTGGGKVDLKAYSATGESNVIVEGLITTAGGAVTLTAGDDIRVRAAVDASKTGGTGGLVTLKALGLNNAYATSADLSEVSITGTGKIVTKTNNVWIETQELVMDAVTGARIDAGTGTLTITRSTEGTISLGNGAPDAQTNGDAIDNGVLKLSQTELNEILAANLVIGDSAAATNKVGQVNVSGANTTDVISGTVTLNPLYQGSIGVLKNYSIDAIDNNSANFSGTNKFRGLTINANDHVVFENNAKVHANGAVLFSTDSNDGTLGQFVMKDSALLETNGQNVTVNTLGVNIGTGSKIDVTNDANNAGGNIDFNNTGIFTAVADSLITKGAGTIELNQNAGGSIQNAIDAINNTGDAGYNKNKIYVGAGTYTGNLTVDVNNLSLIGAVGAIVKANAAGDLVTVTADNVIIDPFTFDGLNIANNGVFANGADGLVVDGNTFLNFRQNGIRVEDSNTVTLKYNIISNFGSSHNGIFLDESNNSEILGNTITGNSSTGGQTGIRVERSTTVQIGNGHGDVTDRNDVTNVGTGIRLTNGAHAITVDNNRLYNINTGIRADGINTLTITDNNIDAHGDRNDGLYGIRVSGGSNLLIGGDDDSNLIDDFRFGIDVNGTTGATVDGNQITDGSYGIAATSVTGNLTITDNFIDAFGANTGDNPGSTSGIDTIGIAVNNIDGTIVNIGGGNGNWDAGTSDGNRIDDFETGIRVEGGNNVTIDNNTVSDAAFYGIYADDVDASSNYRGYYNGLNIVDNVINGYYNNGNNGEGIHVEDSLNAQIGGHGDTNYVEDTNSGIHVLRSESADVEYNNLRNIDGNGITIDDSAYADVKYNDIYDVEDNAIYAEDSDDIEIEHNNIDESDDNGIYVLRSDDAEINQNHINTLYDGNTEEDGILVADSDDVEIEGNVIDDTNDNAIHLRNTDDVWVYNNTITDAHTGIRLPDSGTDGADIDKNAISRVQYGIYADDVADLNIEDNTIDGFNNPWDAQVGIYVKDSYNARIGGYDYSNGWDFWNWNSDGNTVEDFKTGIQIVDSVSANIEHNHVHQFQDYGIRVSDSNHVDVKYNEVHEGNGTGIRVYSSNEAEINDNDVYDVNGHGIELVDSHYVDIMGNDIEDVGQHGIFVDPSNFVDIAYNWISGADWDGINLYKGVHGDVWENDIFGAGDDGIDVYQNSNVDIWKNFIFNTDANGIEVSDSFDAYVGRNTIWFAGDDGINVDESAFADIEYNRVYGSDDNGINVTDSFGADIVRNRVYGAGDDGIHADNVDFGDIYGNHVFGTGDDGIDVRDSKFVDVKRNHIAFTRGDGIQVRNSHFADINGNRVFGAKDDGIDVENSFGVDVKYNKVRFVRNNGIEVSGSDYADINGNNVKFAFDNGIDVEDSDNVELHGNKVRRSGDNGIALRYGRNATLTGNIVTRNGNDGLDVEDYSGKLLITSGNVFSNNGDDGIDIEYTTGVILIDGNTIDGNDDDGIDVTYSYKRRGPSEELVFARFIEDSYEEEYDIDSLIISNNLSISGNGDNGIEVDGAPDTGIFANLITNNGSRGLFMQGPGNGYVVLSGNDFIDNPIGAAFESGLIDLTGETNRFIGGDVALRFAPFEFREWVEDSYEGGDYGDEIFGRYIESPGHWETTGYADMALVDDTIGAQYFEGQSTYFVELANEAFYNPGTPTLLNAQDSTYVTPFGTFRPASTGGAISQDQYDYLEKMFYHFNDGEDLGLFFFGFVPSNNPNIEQQRIFNRFSDFRGQPGQFSITLTGLPNTGGNGGGAGGFSGGLANFLNSITPAGGGNGNNGGGQGGGNAGPSLAQILAALEPSAGGTGGQQGGNQQQGGNGLNMQEASCWSEAIANAGNGVVTTINYNASPDSAFAQGGNCGGGI